jgi:two-component system, OmpR family, sensor histidine kinase KdpD
MADYVPTNRRVLRTEFEHLGDTHVLGAIAAIGVVLAVNALDRKREADFGLLTSEIEKAETERHVVELQLDNQTQRARMIDSVSHELRTPLTVVMARADLLSMKLPPDNERAVTDIEAIKKGAVDLNRMVNSLIDYADKIQSETSTERTIASISSIVNNAVDQQAEDHPDSEISIGHVDEGSIYCDEHFTTRAVWELLDNASRYGSESAPILVRTERSNGSIRFEVEDSGRDLSDEDGADLFKPFERGRSMGAAGKRGLGLGLSFVHTIAELHGGRVFFEKSEDGHSVFGFTIPEGLDSALL